MGARKYDEGCPEPQEEPYTLENETERDLYTLHTTAKRLLSVGLPYKLHDLLELLVRGLDGCPRCKAQYGHRHLSTCGVLGGQTVLKYDLAPNPILDDPASEGAVF